MPLPKDGAGILTVASPLNGLGFPGLKPWHIKASYETFDRKGTSDGHGTFEIWWAGPKSYKQTFTSAVLTQTEYGTDGGKFRTGEASAAPYPQAYLLEQLLHPMPTQEEISEANPERRERDSGKLKLQCVMLSQKIMRVAFAPLGLFPTYCFGAGPPALRISSYGDGIQATFNDLVIFQGRFFARQIAVSDNLVPTISFHVDELNLLGTHPEMFTPPADAVKVDDTPTVVPSGVMTGKILSQPKPQYPLAARQNHVTGTVVFAAVIGRDGRIHRLKILKSPDPDLTLAALIAVAHWEYTPYLLNGAPVDVDTTINVVFAMGRM